MGIIKIAIRDVAPGVGLGSAQLTDAMHYWGVGEVTMKMVDVGVIAPMLATSWELDFEEGSSIPYGATLKIRDDVIFHGQGLGDRSNNGGSWGPMTAADIAFTINDGNGAINPGQYSYWQSCYDFATVFGNNPAVAVDDTTLQVTFANIRLALEREPDERRRAGVQRAEPEPLQHGRRDRDEEHPLHRHRPICTS